MMKGGSKFTKNLYIILVKSSEHPKCCVKEALEEYYLEIEMCSGQCVDHSSEW